MSSSADELASFDEIHTAEEIDARNQYFTLIRKLYCPEITYREMAIGGITSGIIGSATVFSMSKLWPWWRRTINWRMNVVLYVASFGFGTSVQAERIGIFCARGEYDWKLMRLHEEATGQKPMYDPGPWSDLKYREATE